MASLHTPSKLTDNSNFDYLRTSAENSSSSPSSTRQSLSSTAFASLFDAEGRLVDEHLFRRAVFHGGVDADCRADAWKFLFGVFPFCSTPRERDILRVEINLDYAAMKARWKQEVKARGLSLVIDGVEGKARDDCGGGVEETKEFDLTNADLGMECDSFLASSPEISQQISFMRIQANLSAHRQFEMADGLSLDDALKAIHKDVPRTDRETDFYGDTAEGVRNLIGLRDVLATFAAYNKEIGYVQGMNDLLSRFQRVMRSECDTFWCFSQYVRRIGSDFTAEGMKERLESLRRLLTALDVALIRHLESREADDLLACHRWLHLGFKREFTHEQGIKIFEIICSHHLEVKSVKASSRTYSDNRLGSGGDDGEVGTTFSANTRMLKESKRTSLSSDSAVADDKYTFDLFIAVAMLIQMREDLFSCNDQMDVFQVVNNQKNRPHLEMVLSKAESLFFSFCQKSVVNCFQVDDVSSDQKIFHPFDFIADQFKRLL